MHTVTALLCFVVVIHWLIFPYPSGLLHWHCASKATLMNMDKYFMWIYYERLYKNNKAKHNKPVCIFLGIYCSDVFLGISCIATARLHDWKILAKLMTDLTIYNDEGCYFEMMVIDWSEAMSQFVILLVCPILWLFHYFQSYVSDAQIISIFRWQNTKLFVLSISILYIFYKKYLSSSSYAWVLFFYSAYLQYSCYHLNQYL